ncbi:TPA: transglutaminase domain-containing protein [Candidatus Poribacteria bacterium]|nr:transglutaminase domain-containing protein [Candidatus Poribacteria bacterium]
MLTFIITILGILLLWVVYRTLSKRANIYVYVKIGDDRRPVLVAYLKSDGTLIDITKPRGQRRVGQVYLKEGNGIVRLYRQKDLAEEEYEEVGHVDSGGGIFSDGEKVSTISPEGKRHWYELFLRRHADVPESDPEPFGKCVETGRFRARKPKLATLLARAGAALVLYCREAEGADETPRLAPNRIWDTALIASFIFTIIYLIPGFVQLFERFYIVFPFLGKEWSYVVSVTLLYFILWLFLHVMKVAWLSTSNEVIAYLTLVNRQTGIQRWTWLGIFLGIAGILWGYFVDAYIYIPLFIAITIGFIVVASRATAAGWVVEQRFRRIYPDEEAEDVPKEEEGIIKEYSWRLDSPLRDVHFSTHVVFSPEEVETLRKQNPFYQNWQEAAANNRLVARELVLKGENARQVRRIAQYIVNSVKSERLTRFEEIQAVLDFVQEDNIKYASDGNCDEINNAEEYYRSPPETLFDKRGDCDCKSVLAAALMRKIGYPVLLLLSSEAQHAAIAVGGAPELEEIPGLFVLNRGGKRYYFCETTGEGWRVGQPTDLAQTMQNEPESIIDLTNDLS